MIAVKVQWTRNFKNLERVLKFEAKQWNFKIRSWKLKVNCWESWLSEELICVANEVRIQGALNWNHNSNDGKSDGFWRYHYVVDMSKWKFGNLQK